MIKPRTLAVAAMLLFALFFGFAAGNVTGYTLGLARMSDLGAESGLIIRSICEDLDFAGAYYTIDDPSSAKCITEAELSELDPPND